MHWRKKNEGQTWKGISFEDWGQTSLESMKFSPLGGKRSCWFARPGIGSWQKAKARFWTASEPAENWHQCRQEAFGCNAGKALQGTGFPVERAARSLSAGARGVAGITCAGAHVWEELHWMSFLAVPLTTAPPPPVPTTEKFIALTKEEMRREFCPFLKAKKR